MKSSEILRAARPRIESGDDRYICPAVEKVVDNAKEADDLQEHILDMLGENPSLEGWLRRVHGVRKPNQPEHFKVMKRYRERMRITRLAWIDHMVAEFEAKGD